jgi:hypothetical protein
MSAPAPAKPKSPELPAIKPMAESGLSEIEGLEASRHEDISRLAYALWQQRGCPEGSADIDWFEAEQQLRNSAG